MAGKIYGGDGSSWLRNAVTTRLERLEAIVRAQLVRYESEYQDEEVFVLVLPYHDAVEMGLADGSQHYVAGLPVRCSHEVASPCIISKYLADKMGHTEPTTETAK